ncbi:MAG: lamin tail domain-containing protein [Cryomorphaceae bacterium]|nr:lamin tail domain-containing protein [Flavobacteriales bacterium]
MNRILLLFVSIMSAFGANAQCSELFISEYVEGWGNNKAIEIYNPTESAKELSNYRLERYSNGSSSAASNQRLVLEGTIEPYSTYVVVIDKRDPDGEGQEQPVWDELQEKADLFACPVYDENNTMYFNGNDAIVLRNISGDGNGFVVDVFGRIGEDPGVPNQGGGWNDVAPDFTWVANGATAWSTDHSLIRKAEVEIGDFDGGNAFDPSVGYDSIPPVITNEEDFLTGNWESLGTHECVCNIVSTDDRSKEIGLTIYPNPASSSEVLRVSAEVEMNRYEIFDITGKMVFQKNVGNVRTFEVGVTNLNAGIYLLRSYSNGYVSTQKFVVN